MSVLKTAALTALPALLLCAEASASSNPNPHVKPGGALSELSALAGSPDVPQPAASPVGSAPLSSGPASGIEVETGEVNFEYAEMVDRMEGMSRTVIGRNKKEEWLDTGVVPADRVGAGQIKYIVLHASGGATGKPKACEGAVSWLLSQKTAAHFMVCRDGRVIRMAKIENIATHVKNPDIAAASVGIETESGQPDNKTPFVRADWGPQSYWRMYASMAWLIRAIAKETNLPRDRAHVITHEESDRGLPRAHVDPGPFFQSATYPEFDARFPGEAMTPREYLMRLVADDVPPQIWLLASAGSAGEVEVRDKTLLGLAHVRLWRLNAAGEASILIHDWSAPVTGMPPVSLKVDVPMESGSYRVVARDLVGNTSSALVKISEAGPRGALGEGAVKISLFQEPSAPAEEPFRTGG